MFLSNFRSYFRGGWGLSIWLIYDCVVGSIVYYGDCYGSGNAELACYGVKGKSLVPCVLGT